MRFAPLRILCLGLYFLLAVAPVYPGTVLGVKGTQFTINGKPEFLLGISYYAGLGAPEDFMRKDLEQIRKDGFNWIRIWANWGGFDTNISALNLDGSAREPFLSRLEKIVAECDRHGMVVDITLARENGAKEPPGLPSLAAHRRALETLFKKVGKYKNWYLDLANERNVGDKRFVPFEELKVLRAEARELDPDRLITASHSSDDEDLLKHLKDYVSDVRVDFIAQHRSRAPGTARETEAATRKYLERLAELGHPMPIHYQEPFRRGYQDWNPGVEDFVTDLRGAIRGGAAGWCFHNGSQRNTGDEQPRRSFDLREKRLYDQLDPVERKAVGRFKSVAAEAIRLK